MSAIAQENVAMAGECLRNAAARNYAVIDLITDEPVTVNGVEQTGLTAEQAQRISEAANRYMRDDLYCEVRSES